MSSNIHQGRVYLVSALLILVGSSLAITLTPNPLTGTEILSPLRHILSSEAFPAGEDSPAGTWLVSPTSVPAAQFAFLPIVKNGVGSEPNVDDGVYTLVGAGDISTCGSVGDDQTAALLKDIPGTVITLGDNSTENGTTDQFTNCYDPTWGQHKSRTRPAAGNHEYGTTGAEGYFSYFGTAAGENGKGYYSYDLGSWHIIVLNSNCTAVGGCGSASPQGQWLAADLAAHPSRCTLAYFHAPRWSSGPHGNNPLVADFWKAFYEHGVDLVINSHDHDYERFAPLDPNGNSDPSSGIREIVVGTGGGPLRPFGTIQPHSEARSSDTWGVIKLTLLADQYQWEFIPVAGGSFTDTGSGLCN